MIERKHEHFIVKQCLVDVGTILSFDLTICHAI